MRFALVLAFALVGCATVPRGAAVDVMAVAVSMEGCWETSRADGRREALLVERIALGVRWSRSTTAGPGCAGVSPFMHLHLSEAEPTARDLVGTHYAWTVEATPDALVLVPGRAPVWLRLRRIDGNRVEWSTAGSPDRSRPAIDAVVLERSAPAGVTDATRLEPS